MEEKAIPAHLRINEKEAIACLLSMFTGWQFLELMDEISETSLYKHSLKQKIKLLMPELEKFTDNIAMFFNVDSAAMNNLMEHKKELALKLCAMRPELQAGANELLAKYFMMPEWTLHHNGIKIE